MDEINLWSATTEAQDGSLAYVDQSLISEAEKLQDPREIDLLEQKINCMRER